MLQEFKKVKGTLVIIMTIVLRKNHI